MQKNEWVVPAVQSFLVLPVAHVTTRSLPGEVGFESSGFLFWGNNLQRPRGAKFSLGGNYLIAILLYGIGQNK